jgi:DAACS family dicarboxylate/amino acid:cation (Na+ or H+) symporter
VPVKLPLHTRVLLGFALGTAAGIAAYAHIRHGGDAAAINAIVDYAAQPAGQLFLNLLFMLVLPLMFSALVLGVANLGDVAALGRIGSRTLLYTAAVTAIAVAVGLLLVNLIQPGIGFDPAIRDSVMAGAGARSRQLADAHPAFSGVEMLLGIVPRNVLRAAVEDQFLSVMFFALLLGVALVLTPTPATAAFKAAIQGLNELVMKLIGLVIRLTPYAVACLMFALCARFGWDLLFVLGKYVLTVVSAIGLHMFVVLPSWVRLKGKMSPSCFFRGSQEAILTAFSTASSAGTLPTTLKVAEQNLRVPPQVARFVLTIGASANHHGTALFEGLTTLFLAQCFGVTLGLAEQAFLLCFCILASFGTAGVPAGSLPVIAMLLGYLHVPAESIGLILGVDRLLDMCRTALNVTGDLATAVVVARREDADRAPLAHPADAPSMLAAAAASRAARSMP